MSLFSTISILSLVIHPLFHFFFSPSYLTFSFFFFFSIDKNTSHADVKCISCTVDSFIKTRTLSKLSNITKKHWIFVASHNQLDTWFPLRYWTYTGNNNVPPCFHYSYLSLLLSLSPSLSFGNTRTSKKYFEGLFIVLQKKNCWMKFACLYRHSMEVSKMF